MDKGPILGVVVLIAVACVVVVGVSSCTTIEPGYVGIKVNQWGTQRGVEDFPILTGRVFVNPITEKVYEYPTFLQNVIWDREKSSTDPEDHSLTFNSVEGAVVNADIALSYGFDPKKVPHLFVEFRQDAKHITEIYVRSQVRDAFSRYASQMKVVDIFGEGKQKLLDQTKKYLDDALTPKGFKFDSVSFVGALRVDPQVENAINAVISATQRAIEAQNKVVQSKAEADQQIEKARGEAESAVLAAEGEAKAILSKATAQAQANKLQAESLNANLLQWNALQKWDGKLPQFNGQAAIPFLQVQPSQTK